ncbi:RDD family protein [Ornithinimicrobium cryptoxanthini]|uniref:RDD family protein n=1 Tax=Ornithinimicrobium cryptoxanthini TaxID=2934161 RepID=A0ABY4YG15_9MICO|nr:RDD family protein [Ornithinimicrobium cryptoxanthini]USQ75714.1 RDD family protein [Ornithinimicrobium cryptoxanthini]
MSDPTYNGPPGADPAPSAGGQPPPPPPPPGGDQQQPPPGAYQQQPPQGAYQQQPPQGAYQQPQGGYQPAPPAYGAGPSKVGQPAELLDRFLARLIDYVILFVINLIVVSFLIIGIIMGSNAGVMGMGSGGDFLAGVVSSVLLAAIYLGYFAFMESSRGQTIGKMLMKLQTRGPAGGNPTMEQAIRRNIWVAIGILGVIPIIGGILAGLGQLIAVILIAVGISSDTVGRRAWHDTFAGGTQVVKIG